MDKARYEVWQGGIMVAAVEAPEPFAQISIQHYAMQYLQDGPITLKERIKGRMKVVAEARLARD